jgi:hypothetical protein
MGKTYKDKHKSDRVPRNYQVLSMNLRCKGGSMRDRRERRINEDDVHKYVEEWEDYQGHDE